MAFLLTDPLINKPAPLFTLSASTGENISLTQFKGQKVILYFYPKDDTPGCTKQACSFQDNRVLLKERNSVVLGISRDSLASHIKFSKKYNLEFPLLADTEGSVCQLYDVWREKSMYGKTYFGIERSTFVINEEGIITHVWRKVSVTNHINEIMNSIN